jgi:hypothetical protein
LVFAHPLFTGTLTNDAIYELYIGGFCRTLSASSYIYCPATSDGGLLQEQFLVHVSGPARVH